MNHRKGTTGLQSPRIRHVLGAWLLAGATLGAGSPAAAEPAKPVSSCVACHTDAEKLKVEAAKVPPAPASALQAGKG